VPQNSVTQSCLQQLLWNYSSDQNISALNADYFRNISRRLLGNSSNVSTDFRQRREYRQLNDLEREKLHRALQILYDVRINLLFMQQQNLGHMASKQER
jgi:hypothetical protein